VGLPPDGLPALLTVRYTRIQMRFRPASVLLLGAAACLSAQVRFDPKDNTVTIDGKPFTTFHRGEDANKPYLAPLRSASGKIVTRQFPMQRDVPGESKDHLHHRGLWFTYDDVNGVKFWENDPSYTKGKIGKVVVQGTSWKDSTLTAIDNWNDPDGKTLLVEVNKMTFSGDAKNRIIDLDVTLTPQVDVTFGDTKEGAFAIRLAEPFTAKGGGKMVNADGAAGMKDVWGKRSNWVDMTGTIEGEPLGIAIFDNPSNPRHPTYWHARDYGLFALNPFGQKAFDPSKEESQWKVPAKQKLEFKWRVVIHPADANIAEMYKAYAAKK
jgi:hypothetical protein